LDSIQNIRKTKELIKKAFEAQIEGKGFGLVEILASCPTNWHLSPQESHERIRNELFKVYPLGVYKE
jgi:2-oxoglutarate/2-oxoacid ferredoxin oxidoreductase subunit beta